jgi:hypothetical protein
MPQFEIISKADNHKESEFIDKKLNNSVGSKIWNVGITYYDVQICFPHHYPHHDF